MIPDAAFADAPILVIDDEDMNTRMLERLLAGAGYRRVRSATDPREGLRLYEELRPDLMLLDLNMPHLDGFRVMEETTVRRRRDEPEYLPILMLTADTDRERRLKALKSGAKDFVNKPFDPLEVLARVRNLLEVRLLHRLLREKNRELDAAWRESERLLLNILPQEVAKELKAAGRCEPVRVDDVSILFADFQGFTRATEEMSPARLVAALEEAFGAFDAVVEAGGLEKLKTIGDSYMAAGGLPRPNRTHAVDCVLAGLAMQRAAARLPWRLRVGVHTGPVMAGVIGQKKFAYDVWGSAVNTASRMESAGEPCRINISAATYDRVRPFFACEPRGARPVKGQGPVEMYFALGLRPELSEDGDGARPNAAFRELYDGLRS